MVEYTPQKRGLQFESPRTVIADGIKIVKFKIKPGSSDAANIDTIYSPSETDFGLETIAKDIEKAKLWKNNVFVIKFVKDNGSSTTEEHINKMATSYIEILKTTKRAPIFKNDLLFPLIKQKALEKLFKAGKPLLK